MATINSKDTIDQIMANGGWDDDTVKYLKSEGMLQDPPPDALPVRRIVEYTNAWGKQAWGVTWDDDDPDRYLRASSYVQDPRVIWERR